MDSPDIQISTPDLTPEEKIKERRMLAEIDQLNEQKARLALAAQETNIADPEYEALARASIQERIGAFATKMAVELDPEYEYAIILPVTDEKIVETRQFGIKKLTTQLERREIAAWALSRVKIDSVVLPYIGRDGQLYGSMPEFSYQHRVIPMDALSIGTIQTIEKGIEDEEKSYSHIRPHRQ